MLSQHIETTHAVQLVALGGVGNLLKNRVLDGSAFLTTAERVADGGSALHPMVVSTLISSNDDGHVRRRPAVPIPGGPCRCRVRR